MGIVFQDFALFPHLSVAENVAFGIEDWAPDRREERVADLLELVGLEGYADHSVDDLSGGQRKRVALARSMAPEPDVLLLDEPVSNVDAANRAEILDLLADLSDRGVTLVTSTPDTELVPHVADRVVLFDADGTVADTGPTREILTDAGLLADCALQPPQVVRLFDGRGEIPLTVEEAQRRLDTE